VSLQCSLATSPICNPPSTPFSSVPHHVLPVSLQPFHQAFDPSEIAIWRSDSVNPTLRVPVANLTCAASGGRLTQSDRSIHCPSSSLDIAVGKYMSPEAFATGLRSTLGCDAAPGCSALSSPSPCSPQMASGDESPNRLQPSTGVVEQDEKHPAGHQTPSATIC
jgi:hypothetical protein